MRPGNKPNKTVERAAGIGGQVLTVPWIFSAAVHVIDWIGRGQTTLTLPSFVETLATPWANLIELLGAVSLLYYATRLEDARELDEAPRVILPYSKPPELRRLRIWLKLAVVVCIVSVGCAGALSWVARPKTPASTAQPVKPALSPLPEPAKRPLPEPKLSDSVVLTEKSWVGNGSMGTFTWRHNLKTMTPQLSCFNLAGEGIDLGITVKDQNTVVLHSVKSAMRCTLRR